MYELVICSVCFEKESGLAFLFAGNMGSALVFMFFALFYRACQTIERLLDVNNTLGSGS